MGNLVGTLKRLCHGYGPLLFWSLATQVLMIFMTVFTTFLTQVLVDAIEGLDTLQQAFFLEQSVIWLITGGKGAEFLFANRAWLLPLSIAASGVATACSSLLRMIVRAMLGTGTYASMQLTLFTHLERLPYTFYKENKPGDLIQTATRDTDVLRRFMIRDLSGFNYTFWMLFFCVGTLFAINWKLALVSVSLFPIMFIYSFFLIKHVRRRFRKCDDSEAMMTDRINENLLATRIIKAYGAETREIARFEDLLADYRVKFISWRKMSSFFFSSSDIFVFGSKVLSLLFSFYLVFTGEINAGTLVVTILFIDMIVWPVRETSTSLSNLGQQIAAADRIKRILDYPEEDVTTGTTPTISGNVRFEDVYFRYPDGEQYSVAGVSFHIEAGKTLAIMGKTGSGKSTLAYLLTRLYEPTSGHIYVDGEDISNISKHHLRRNIIPVLQDPFLFSKTVTDNILMGRKDATIEEIKDAARIASVDDTIRRLEKGYDTQVGEKGTSLSGGQKQRVAIARSLVASSPVLILDDSLSAVDTETDLRIRENLAKRENKPTTIIVTHRVMTAKDADYIILLDQGKIVEEGNHAELLKKNGLYRQISDIQGKMA